MYTSAFCLVYTFCYFIYFTHNFYKCVIMHSMKVTRNLQISATEFFDAVFDEVIQEIERLDKTKISKDSLKTGFHYVHTGTTAYDKIEFKIVEYQEEHFYKCIRSSIQGTSSLSYEVSAIENGITVTFTQESDTAGTPKKKKSLVSIFTEGYILGRMTDKLYGFQNKIIDEKEGYITKDYGNPLLPTVRRKK